MPGLEVRRLGLRDHIDPGGTGDGHRLLCLTLVRLPKVLGQRSGIGGDGPGDGDAGLGGEIQEAGLQGDVPDHRVIPGHQSLQVHPLRALNHRHIPQAGDQPLQVLRGVGLFLGLGRVSGGTGGHGLGAGTAARQQSQAKNQGQQANQDVFLFHNSATSSQICV